MEIPQPPLFPPPPPDVEIDLTFFPLVDLGSGLQPLPTGSDLAQFALFGPRTGTFYSAVITHLGGVGDLPTSTVRDVSIQWNLSNLSSTTGEVFLATVTLPFSELTVPEPDLAYLSGILLGCLFGLHFVRCKSPALNST